MLEWNTVTDTLVHQHSNRGTIFGTPRDDRIFVTNSANSSSTILIPGGGSTANPIKLRVRVEG